MQMSSKRRTAESLRRRGERINCRGNVVRPAGGAGISGSVGGADEGFACQARYLSPSSRTGGSRERYQPSRNAAAARVRGTRNRAGVGNLKDVLPRGASDGGE